MSFVDSYGLLGLFFFCFLAATIFPLSSEVLVTALLLSKTQDPIHILVVATIGNSLGGFVNYTMGYYGGLTWFKRHRAVLEKYKFTQWIQKYGSYTAIIGWVPLIGDSLLIALGFYRVNFWSYTFFMILGKTLRYSIIIYILN